MSITPDSPQVGKGWQHLTVQLGKRAPKHLAAIVRSGQLMLAATRTKRSKG